MKTILPIIGLMVSLTLFQWTTPRRLFEKGGGFKLPAEGILHSQLIAEKKKQGKFIILGRYIAKNSVAIYKQEILLADWKNPDKIFILDMTGLGDEFESILSLQSLDVEEEDGEVTKIVGYSKKGHSYTREFNRFKKPRVDITNVNRTPAKAGVFNSPNYKGKSMA